jgi:hypothetical protein
VKASKVADALAYNALIAAACAARPEVTCLFPWDTFEAPYTDAAERGYLKEAYDCDGIHLLQAGSDTLAGLVRTAFP